MSEPAALVQQLFDRTWARTIMREAAARHAAWARTEGDAAWRGGLGDIAKARGRPEEARLSEDYLAEVNRAYNHYFFHYAHTPLLVVNTTDLDFARRPEDLDDLMKQIAGMGKGTQYYVPRA